MRKIKKLIFLSTCIFSWGSCVHASQKQCEFKTFNNIIVLDNSKIITKENTSIILENNCDKNTTEELINIINKSQGSLSQRYLDEYFSNRNIKPRLLNKKVRILNLKKLLKTKLPLDDNYAFFSLKHVSNKDIIGIDDIQNLEISCAKCNTTGPSSFFLVFKDKKMNILRREIFSTTIKQKISAYFPKKQLNTIGKALKRSQFVTKTIYTDKPQTIFTRKDGLIFFKSSKQLSPTKPLRIHDLSPIDLVKRGSQVSVTLVNSQIRLSTHAQAMERGKFNQIIQIKINHKLLNAKITGHNKAEVIQ